MMFSYLVVCLTTVGIFAQHSNNIDFKSFPCEPGYKTNKDCFKIYPNIICTACSEWEYQNYCFNHFTNATCMTCTECDVLASACAVSQSSFCKLSNDTQKNDTPRNGTHMNNIQKDMLYGAIIIVLCVFAVFLTCIFLILRKRMKKRRLENLSCQIVHDENILIERPETKIELLDKKIELPTRIRKKKDDKVPMLTKYDMEPYVEVPQNGRSVVDGNATVEDETKTRSSRKAPIFEQEDTSTPSLRLRRDSQPIVIHKHQYIYQGPAIKTKGKNTQISIGSNKGDMQIKHNMDDAANGEDEPLLFDQDHEDVTKQIVPFDVHDTKSHPTSVEQGDNDNKNGGIINYDDVNRGEVFDSVNDENEKIGGHENNETSFKSDKVEDSSLDERKIETDKPATKQLSGTDRKEKSTEKILKRGVSESHESLFNIEDVKAQFSNMDEYKHNSRRCVNEYTPLDVEQSQDEGIGLSSIMEEHDDSSRCEIENTPLLSVRCEIKNTTPLDVELNQDERIGVSSLAEPDLNSKYKADDDNEIKPVDPKETEKQTAVVYPYDETKSNGCKEVGHKDDILRHITKEHFQGTGVYENKEEQGSEIKTKENQICLRSEDQSLSSMDPDKGTSELQIIDWTKVFLQLSRSFSPTHWKLFALELLSNCQEMARSVDKTVNEIELEARNQHTEGWVIHAYFKVFNKWLNNLGSTRATFEHIKDAATNAFDSVEDKNRIDSIKRNPPMKVATPMCPPLVPCKLDRTFGSNYAHSQQYMALHDNEAQGNSNCEKGIYVSSIQTRSYQLAHCPYCSRYTTNEISNQEETLVQLNKNSIETKYNDIDEREQTGKRKKDQSTTQQNKRIANDKYIVENAKQNLLFDIMPIRQNDYDLFMDFVIDVISNECHVSQEAVLSITYEGFCKAHQTKTKENETLYIIKSGKTSLCIGEEVFEDLAVYGNIARPKLLKYLEEKNIDCDNTTLLFIKFEHMKNKDDNSVRNDAEKKNNAEQTFQVNGQNGPHIGLCPDMNETEEPFNIKTSLKQNSSGQLYEPEEKVGTTQVEHEQKELDNKGKSEQETVTNNGKDDKDADIEKELESIKESFFPDGNETYDLPTADNVAHILNKFMDQD